MSKSHKNQHYVPVFYFNQFTLGERLIHILLKDTGIIRQNISINSQCSEKYFFGDSELELMYGKIETKIANLFRGILINQKLPVSFECQLLLRLAVAFQYNRTLKQRSKLAEKVKFDAEAVLDTIIRRDVKEGKYKFLTEDFIEKIKIQTYDKNIHLDLLGEFLLGGSMLIDLSACLLRNHTKNDFIFCDSPCIFFNQAFSHIKGWGNIGYLSQGLQIFYPLSSKILLLLYDPRRYDLNSKRDFVELYQKDDITKLNAMQIHNAHETVYFANEQQASRIESIWIREKDRFNQPPAFQEFPAKDATGEVTGKYILHSECSFQYPLNLSFLKAKRVHVPRIFNPIDYIRNPRLGRCYQSAMRVLRENARKAHQGIPVDWGLNPVEHELFIRAIEVLFYK